MMNQHKHGTISEQNVMSKETKKYALGIFA